MNYYRNTFVVLGFIVVMVLVAATYSISWAKDQHDTFLNVTRAAIKSAREKAIAEGEEKQRERLIQPMRQFIQAWEPFVRPAPTKDLGNFVRNELATRATQHGLTTENGTVPPDAQNYTVGGTLLRVQRTSITAVGESLPRLMTWLGDMEQRFPYARAEALSIASYGSRSAQLSITLLHPVEETASRAAKP